MRVVPAPANQPLMSFTSDPNLAIRMNLPKQVLACNNCRLQQLCIANDPNLARERIHRSKCLLATIIQSQCLSKTALNGEVGFGLGSVGERVAVYVPIISRKLSMNPTKLLLLSPDDAEYYSQSRTFEHFKYRAFDLIKAEYEQFSSASHRRAMGVPQASRAQCNLSTRLLRLQATFLRGLKQLLRMNVIRHSVL